MWVPVAVIAGFAYKLLYVFLPFTFLLPVIGRNYRQNVYDRPECHSRPCSRRGVWLNNRPQRWDQRRIVLTGSALSGILRWCSLHACRLSTEMCRFKRKINVCSVWTGKMTGVTDILLCIKRHVFPILTYKLTLCHSVFEAQATTACLFDLELWPLTFWPQNLISPYVSLIAPNL